MVEDARRLAVSGPRALTIACSAGDPAAVQHSSHPAPLPPSGTPPAPPHRPPRPRTLLAPARDPAMRLRHLAKSSNSSQPLAALEAVWWRGGDFISRRRLASILSPSCRMAFLLHHHTHQSLYEPFSRWAAGPLPPAGEIGSGPPPLGCAKRGGSWQEPAPTLYRLIRFSPEATKNIPACWGQLSDPQLWNHDVRSSGRRETADPHARTGLAVPSATVRRPRRSVGPVYS